MLDVVWAEADCRLAPQSLAPCEAHHQTGVQGTQDCKARHGGTWEQVAAQLRNGRTTSEQVAHCKPVHD